MSQQVCSDPLTLHSRLQAEAGTCPVCAEALARIRQLEKLCGMMTDTGVILEENVADLVQADTWWVPNDTEYCYTNLQEAMEEVARPGDIVEWGRAHTLDNGWAILLEEVKDSTGRVVVPGGVREFESYEEAEEAAAEYEMRKRRAEYRL